MESLGPPIFEGFFVECADNVTDPDQLLWRGPKRAGPRLFLRDQFRYRFPSLI